MSWDHRALDGMLAAQFLNALRKKLESWPTT
jgi:pyruvate/2-oxoglutarate dehydrogenase complex dihydrolipoamide acyltransferase (E2) component